MNLLISAVNVGTGALFAVLLGILLIALVLIAVWFLTRNIGVSRLVEEKDQKKETFMGLSIGTSIAFVILVGVVIRIIFGLFVKGDGLLYEQYVDAIQSIKDNGIGGYYSSGKLFPLTVYIVGFFGGLIGGGLSTDGVGVQLLLKLPFMLADIGTAILLYKIGKRYLNSQVGIIVAALFFLNPLFIMTSGIASSNASLVALVLLFAFYFMVCKRYFGFIAMFFVAILIDKIVLLFVVPFAVYVVYLFVKGVKVCRDKGVEGLIQDKSRSVVLMLPIYIVVCLAMCCLISWPLMMQSKNSFFGVFDTIWLQNTFVLQTFGKNALSIFNIFLRNGLDLGQTFPSLVFVIIFLLLSIGIVLALFLVKKNRANFVLISSFVAITLATYYVDMTAYSIVPSLVLLLLSFLLIRDKRLLKAFLIFSLLLFVNAMAAITHSGNFANVVVGDGSLYLDSGGARAFSIICTVCAIITHIYLTIVVLDICLSNKIKLLYQNSESSFVQSIKAFASR